MSFAFLALYTGDYLRDTRHLTPLKHGVYLLLLMHCWDSRGPVPLDEQECAGIANCRSADEIAALRYVLERFFVRLEDGWYNSRMQREIERASEISAKREDAGRRGANERMRRFRESQAIAKQVVSKSQASDATPTTTTTPTTNPPPSSKALSGYRADAVSILTFLNEKAGRAYRPTKSNIALIEARLRAGATPKDCRQVIAKKCREWLADPVMNEYLRPATLFNATKFDQYSGELVIPKEEQNAE